LVFKKKGRKEGNQAKRKHFFYLEINLINGIKDLYIKHCKTQMKETEDTNKSKAISCSCIRNYIVKISILPKTIYKFNTNVNKIQSHFYRNRKKSQNS
jgi:hypothetical protein